MKYLFTMAFISISILAKTQEAKVEKSIFGIQTGLFGIWVQNESGLSNSIALRSEVGFATGLFGGTYYRMAGYLIAPELSIEPRFYYNLKKRLSKSKQTENNSGNYLSINTRFHPDWFIISNYDNVAIISDILIIPSWGIRRHIGKHVNSEIGIGIGYRYILAKSAEYIENESGVAANLRLRIGYTL